jgi:hypothetical protein
MRDGEKIGLYVKAPERTFTAEQKNLDKGHIWWGGPMSGEKRISFQHPLVEEQTAWQAVYLLELYKNEIPAEVPLAIIEHPDGNSEIVVYDAVTYPYEKRCSHKDKLEERVKGLGFYPKDLGYHNFMNNIHGTAAIIDVNRWLWSPHTDRWMRSLKEAIEQEIEK